MASIAQQAQQPQLSLGNRIYLYGVLSRQIGVGKQTFMPQVEEALAEARMSADDLGFTDTRSLLEAMGDCVRLTVFKGGRVYATLVAQAAWDEALATAEAKPAGDKAKANGKSWKRKKTNKDLKPVRPRRVKRPKDVEAKAVEAADVAMEPATDTAAEAGAAVFEAASGAEHAEPVDGAAKASSEPSVTPLTAATEEPAVASTAASAGDAPEACEAAEGPLTQHEDVQISVEPAEAEHLDGEADAHEDDTPAAHQPSISLTILYDPTADEDESYEDGSSPVGDIACEPAARAPEQDTPAAANPAPMPAATAAAHEAPAAVAEPAPAATTVAAAPIAPAPVPSPATAPAAPVAPDAPDYADYPVDFALEVYCPNNLLAALAQLLPYGADVLGILGAYFDIAKLRRTIEGTRSRATFPMGYIEAGERHEALVTIKRKNEHGLTWAVAAIEQD